jgi:TonB family protein
LFVNHHHIHIEDMRLILNSLLIGLICLSTVGVSAQEDKVWPMVEYMPTLPGCENKKDRNERRNCTREKIAQHLVTYLKYPPEAKKAGEEGVAVISFVVRKDGDVTDLMLDEDPGYGMGAAAMKAVKRLSKEWLPGEHLGEVASVRMKIPVQFEIPDEQVEEKSAIQSTDVYTVVDEMPSFKGCGGKDAVESRKCTFQKIMEYTNTNLKYPEEAKTAKVEGTVKVKFIIDEEGNVTSPSIVEGIGGGCDEEALRLISSMPQWNAGHQDGQPVKVEMELPLRFQIRGK